MNKHTAIVTVSLVAIASTLVYSALNIYAANHLDYRWSPQGEFNFFSLIAGGNIEVCNPTFLPVTFREYKLDFLDEGKVFSSFVVEGTTIQNTSILQGKLFPLNLPPTFFLMVDAKIAGNAIGRTDINLNEDFVIMKTETNLLGFFPITIQKEYSGIEFYNNMNREDDAFCKSVE